MVSPIDEIVTTGIGVSTDGSAFVPCMSTASCSVSVVSLALPLASPLSLQPVGLLIVMPVKLSGPFPTAISDSPKPSFQSLPVHESPVAVSSASEARIVPLKTMLVAAEHTGVLPVASELPKGTPLLLQTAFFVVSFVAPRALPAKTANSAVTIRAARPTLFMLIGASSSSVDWSDGRGLAPCLHPDRPSECRRARVFLHENDGRPNSQFILIDVFHRRC